MPLPVFILKSGYLGVRYYRHPVYRDLFVDALGDCKVIEKLSRKLRDDLEPSYVFKGCYSAIPYS
ncbi:hypothetical protein SPFM1_00286 [Salmonella phage SPFM1]|nr:hypothetical protein SPFM1_00286 [Salmonella phage SPFM1]